MRKNEYGVTMYMTPEETEALKVAVRNAVQIQLGVDVPSVHEQRLIFRPMEQFINEMLRARGV